MHEKAIDKYSLKINPMNNEPQSISVGSLHGNDNKIINLSLNIKKQKKKKELIGEKEYLYIIDKQGQYIDFLLKIIRKWISM